MDYAVEMIGITKRFGPLIANNDVTLQVKKGEIHALLGENGAGKSTLMSILFGLYQADEGVIKVNGEVVQIQNPNDANRLKIGMVHQHFKLVDVFTVTENIILGAEPTRRGIVEFAKCEQKVEELSKKYKLDVDPRAYTKDITVGMQQRVEILKMLYRDAEILIFDEPTAVLTPQEILELIKIMKDFASKGKTIIVITHKLNEIKEMADRCTILRKGELVGTVDVASTSVSQLAEMMVGRKVIFQVSKKEANATEELFEAKNLVIKDEKTKTNVVNDVSFVVKRGEIVCIAGVDGNGQSELIRGITGLLPIHSGSITLKGEDITCYDIRKRLELGMGHIPEDRQKDGLVLDYNLAENMILSSYFKKPFQRKGILKPKEMYRYASKVTKEYDVRSSNGITSIVRGMSGGNQQKAILAREVSRNPDLLIAVQPTRGLDVGAIEFIHRNLIAHRDQNKSVLVVSYELEEVMGISDRILVMYNGQIVADLKTKETDVNELGLYMLGVKGGSNDGKQ